MNSSNKGSAHVSCNCRSCRHAPSKVKTAHKVEAHRAIRRAGKVACRDGGEDTRRVSTGYKA